MYVLHVQVHLFVLLMYVCMSVYIYVVHIHLSISSLPFTFPAFLTLPPFTLQTFIIPQSFCSFIRLDDGCLSCPSIQLQPFALQLHPHLINDLVNSHDINLFLTQSRAIGLSCLDDCSTFGVQSWRSLLKRRPLSHTSSSPSRQTPGSGRSWPVHTWGYCSPYPPPLPYHLTLPQLTLATDDTLTYIHPSQP